MNRSSTHDLGVLESDETFSLESNRQQANSSSGVQYCESDLVLLFTEGECDAKVDGVTERYSAGEVLYVPAEQKHELANVGEGRLEVWLTVTPNVTPSHTFYDEQPDGTWERVTPRLDGEESRPASL